MVVSDPWNKERSWGDALQVYTRCKTGRSNRPLSSTPKSKRLDKRTSRHFNILTQSYYSPSVESQTRQKELDEAAKNIEKGKFQSIRHSSKWNILNHTSKKDGQKLGTLKWGTKPRHRKWDIVSNRRVNTDGQYVDYALSEHPPPASDAQPDPVRNTSIKTITEKRDYNIMTNEYHEDHAAKRQCDRDFEKNWTAQKCQEKLVLNPLTCRYYNREKENQAKKIEEQKLATHYKKSIAKMPYTTKYSEGHNYNVINNCGKDHPPTMYRKRQRMNMMRKRFKFEDRARLKSLRDQMKAERAALSRTSVKRVVESRKFGRNIINNIDFKGINGETPYASRIPRPQSMFELSRSWRQCSGGQEKGAVRPLTSHGRSFPMTQYNQFSPAVSTNSAPSIGTSIPPRVQLTSPTHSLPPKPRVAPISVPCAGAKDYAKKFDSPRKRQNAMESMIAHKGPKTTNPGIKKEIGRFSRPKMDGAKCLTGIKDGRGNAVVKGKPTRQYITGGHILY